MAGKPGKRVQPWTEREARRLLRAGKAEGQNCILRKLPDGTLELVPVIAEVAERATDDLDRELKDFQARHGQG